VTANDDACSSSRSAAAFAAVAGTTYLVAVDSYAPSRPGRGAFTLSLAVTDGPTNDDAADAEVVGGPLPIVVQGSNVGADAEPGEPAHGGFPTGSSVWYSWTPAASGRVEVATCGTTGLDTVVAVYTGGAVDDLTLVASDDDGCAPLASQLELDAVAGTTYLVVVDGWAAAEGSFSLSFADAGSRPVNDDFADATVLDGPLPIAVSGSTRQATRERNEPRHGWFDHGAATVWYRWTAPTTDHYRLDTCSEGTNYFSSMAVYAGGSLTSLTLIEADPGEACGFARITLDAEAGETYDIVIGGSLPDYRGEFRLEISDDAPANDNLASAEVLDGPLPITRAGTTDLATREMDEPDLDGQVSTEGLFTTWYSWVADRTGRMTVDTCGGDSEVVLDVFTGGTYADLVRTARSNAGCGRQAQVTFAAVAGTRYLIRATTGFSGVYGEVPVTLGEAAPPPANDDLAHAEVLPARLPVTVTGTNVGAGPEPGEPAHGGRPAEASIWWDWTAPRSGEVLLATCATPLDTVLAVYVGTAVTRLVPIAANDDSCSTRSQVRFAVAAGTTYHIVVEGYAGGVGAIQLAARWSAAPPNDDFVDAQRLRSAVPIEAHGTTVDATLEPGEHPEVITGGSGSSVWYRWTAPTSGPVVLETCGSDTPAIPSAWTGTSVAATAHVVVDELARCGSGHRIRFTTVAGTSYLLAVDATSDHGRDGDLRGRFALTIRRPVAPANDAFTAARRLEGRLPIEVRGTDVDATQESLDPGLTPGEPDAASPATVWYRWTASTAAPVVIDTCGSSSETAVGVFTGSTLIGLVAAESHGPFDEPEAACGGPTSSDGRNNGAYRFTPVPGTTYSLAVAGFARDQGSFRLTVRREAPPANDDFVDAAPLPSRLPTDAVVDLSDADNEAGEGHGWATAWYSWTPRRSETVVAETCGTALDTQVAVYTGAGLGQLALVGQDGGRCGPGGVVTFDAVAGTTYRLVVTARHAGGPAALRIRRPAPPANDDLADARVLRATGTVRGSTVDATAEPGEPVHAGVAAGASVWHRWTPAASGLATVDTCGSEFATALAVYGGDPAGLRHVASDDAGACGGGSMVVFPVVAGRTYWIAVDGSADVFDPRAAEGAYRLTTSLR
jgi:hypothetical protein